MTAPARPPGLFDREREWAEIVRFATAERPGASLGIVSGRRRQGKTFLLRSLVGALGGLHHEAVEADRSESLRRFAADYAAHARLPATPAFTGWDDALAAILALGEDAPLLVVLDELPYLTSADPSLPSLVQRWLSPSSAARERSRTRLVVCGSALSVMGGLTRADAPLRGRAGLELVLRPLPFRDAAALWGLEDDPWTALCVAAVLGGTPAYRTDLADYDAPTGAADFDDWVVRVVLNPRRPLFREGRVLVAEEPGLRERALYHSVLAAVAEGNETRERLASRVGRPATALTHPLTVLLDAGLLGRREDAFRRRRATYRVTEPLLRFHHLVIRPNITALETLGEGDRVWAAARGTFSARILGPHFEELCREWVLRHATTEEVGGLVAAVTSGVLHDPRARSSHEVDVAAWGVGEGGARRFLLLGEAKVGMELGMADVERLRALRDLAVRSGHDAAGARLGLFSGAGFSEELRAHAVGDHEVLLVDLDQLYGLAAS